MSDDSFIFVNVEPDNLSKNETEMQVDSTLPEMKSMHVVSNVRNRYARTVVTSKYVNPNTRAQEATFSIILPDTAFIAGFVMEIKGKQYKAYVKEKEEAKQDYQQAVASGRAAAHVAVNARDSNKFTVSVNMEPRSDVIFILTYEELLVRKHGKYEMVINLHPGQVIDDLKVDVNINETRSIVNVEIPGLRSGNEVTDKITKNKYATIKKENEKTIHISFHPTAEQQKEMACPFLKNGISGQFIIEYDVERDPLGGEVLVHDGHFVHFFAPTELKPIPKYVIFVLDVSGSMHGRKIEQLQEAMKVILSELNPEDYFNIIKFNDTVQILYSNNSFQEAQLTCLPATPENIEKAQKVVDSMQADGCTNISDALITALSLTLKGVSSARNKENKHKPQPIIVFLTDGQANRGEMNPKRIIEIVDQRNEIENKSAIFTLAFGNDANKELLKELALKNSGFLRNIYEASDASLQLQDFYKQISSPLLTNVNFKYSDKVKDVTKHKFDIFFNGSEFVVTGKVDKIVDEFVIVDGSTLYGINDFRPTIVPICHTKEDKDQFGTLERLWAYMTIKQLLDKKYEEKEQDKNPSDTEMPEKQALKLALKYSFVTPVTSLVVVKPEDTVENDLEWGVVNVAPSITQRPSYRGGGGGPSFFQQMPSIPQQRRGCSKRKKCPPFLTEIWDLSDQKKQCVAKQVSGQPLRQLSSAMIQSGSAQIPSPMFMCGPPSPAFMFNSNPQQSANLTTTFGSSSNFQPASAAFGGCTFGSQPSTNLATTIGTGSNVQLFGSGRSQPTSPAFMFSSNPQQSANLAINSFVQPKSAAFGFSSNPQQSANLATIINQSVDSAFLLRNYNYPDIGTSVDVVPNPQKIRSIKVVTGILNCYAHTTVTSTYVNQNTQALQMTFSIVLPDAAFVTGITMEMKGTKYEAKKLEKEEANIEYQKAVSQGQAAIHVSTNVQDSKNLTVFINAEPQSDVTFILMYEELLIQKNKKYEVVTNLQRGCPALDMEVDIKIEDAEPIVVEKPIFISGDTSASCQYAVVSDNNDNGFIHINFIPIVDQQRDFNKILKRPGEIIRGNSCQLVVEYKTEEESDRSHILVGNAPVPPPVTDFLVIKSN